MSNKILGNQTITFLKQNKVKDTNELKNELKELHYKNLAQHIVLDNLRKENMKLKNVVDDLKNKNTVLTVELDNILKITGLKNPWKNEDSKLHYNILDEWVMP